MKAKFPKKISERAFHAKIYFTKNRGRDAFTLDYKDLDGIRQRWMFKTAEAAEEEGRAILRGMGQGKCDTVVISDTDRLMLTRAKAALEKIDVPLDIAVLDYVDAVEMLGGRHLKEAVRLFAQVGGLSHSRMTISEAVDRFLADRQANQAEDTYYNPLRWRLKRFERAFNGCRLNSIMPDEIGEFVAGIKGKPRTRQNYRSEIQTFFNFCKAQGYVGQLHLGVGGNSRQAKVESEIKVFSPMEMSAILKVIPRPLLAAVAIGAFAGLRTQEIGRLDWSEVRLDRGKIEVTGPKSKTKKRRLAPISSNLAAWLELVRQPKGRVANYKNVGNRIGRFAAGNDITWRRNGMRHSFISYRTALIENLPKVALEAGNSPQIIQRRYLEVVDKPEAQEWFNITPESVGRMKA